MKPNQLAPVHEWAKDYARQADASPAEKALYRRALALTPMDFAGAAVLTVDVGRFYARELYAFHVERTAVRQLYNRLGEFLLRVHGVSTEQAHRELAPWAA